MLIDSNSNLLTTNEMVQRLGQFVDNIISQQPKLITKEDVDSIFYKVIYDRKNFKLNDEKETYLRNEFES